MFCPDQPRQVSQNVDAGRPARQRLARHIPRNERQHFAALVVESEWPWSRGEPIGMQMRQELLNRRAERPPRTPNRVTDPDDP